MRKAIYYPSHYTPENQTKPVDGLQKVLAEIGQTKGIIVASPIVHRPVCAFTLDTLPEMLFVELNNRHQADGYILYADFIWAQCGFADDPSLGQERLKRSVNSIRIRQNPAPIIVVLFTSPEECYPELTNVLDGKANFVFCQDKPIRRLALEIIGCFTHPRMSQ